MADLDVSDLARFAFFQPLEACAWADFNALPPEARRNKFTIPGVEDAKMIAAAHTAMARVLSGEKGEGKRLECFVEAGGYFTRDHYDVFEIAWRFYSALAHSAAAFPASLDSGVLEAYPADELCGSGKRKEPCDWPVRWARAGGTFFGARMIAPARSPVWEKISAIGLPFPPFEFGSRMERRSVAEREWRRLTQTLPR